MERVKCVTVTLVNGKWVILHFKNVAILKNLPIFNIDLHLDTYQIIL